MVQVISEDAAIERLREAVERAGSQQAYATICGVTRPFITQCLNGRSAIVGKVAEHLGIKRGYAYYLLENKKDPRQADYEKKIKEYKELHGVNTEPMKGIAK